MKRGSRMKRSLAFLLILAMVLPILPADVVLAAEPGTKVNGDTGLVGDIDPANTIDLPIEIYDYPADGLLFEYSADNRSYMPGGDWWKTAFNGWGENFATMPNPDWDPWISSKPNSNGATTVNLVVHRAETEDPIAGNTAETFHDIRAESESSYDSDASLHHACWFSSRFGDYNAEGNTRNDRTNTPMDDIRYLTLVYRTNVESGTMCWNIGREQKPWGEPEFNRTAEIPFTQKGATGEGTETRWTYAVFDLKTGKLGETWTEFGQGQRIYMGTPMTAAGQWMDVSAIAHFKTEKDARQFGEYAITGHTVRGSNLGFGLLFRNKNENGTDRGQSASEACPTVQLAFKDTANDRPMETVSAGIGYNLHGTFGKNGWATMGLLKSSLTEDGLPQYKDEVVDYVAGLLYNSLNLAEHQWGWTNYMEPRGEVQDRFGGVDLPTALSGLNLTNDGSAAAAAGKNLIGTWEDCRGNIKTYHDAAFFLLNNIFVPDSYNIPQHDYDYLTLAKGTMEDGTVAYGFDGGFGDSADAAAAKQAVAFNEDGSRAIYNTSAAGKPMFYFSKSGVTTMFPFLPVTSGNNEQGQTVSPNVYDNSACSHKTEQDTYLNRNFNYVLRSRGEFVYHAEDDLFFQFEGDDDVYLFVNGELVMDLGGAHSISKEVIHINDYVNEAWNHVKTGNPTERDRKLALEEGNTYRFDFFYMERHGYGANMRMATNIHVTDPKVNTEKRAYQDGNEISYGGIIDPEQPVEYGFEIVNKSENSLFDITFNDRDIGLRLSPENGFIAALGSRLCDPQGGPLDVTDLVATVDGFDETGVPTETVRVTFKNNEELKAFLHDLTAEGTQGGDKAGLWKNSTLNIRGMGYRLTEEQRKAAVFDNVVQSSARSGTGTNFVYGAATHRVCAPTDPMYYQWAGKPLEISKEKLITDAMAAATSESNTLFGKTDGLTTGNVTSLQLTTGQGNPLTSPDVEVTDEKVTVHYREPGARVFYVKAAYGNNQQVVIPVLINSAGVKESVFVLDYGLDVDLAQGRDLFKDDPLTVPGRQTEHKMEGMTGTEPSYAGNHISFDGQTGPMKTTYGQFEYKNGLLSYHLDKFLEGSDQVWAAVRVHETDFTEQNPVGTVNINREVEMYKPVSVIPANVVYYEDDFPAIHYSEIGENTIEVIGSSVGKKQEADQNEEYGRDDAYQVNEDDSAGSLHKISIGKTGVVASFTFTGTGFEIIGRTNARDSATLMITVKNSAGDVVKRFPVITELDQGGDGGAEELCQVPVIRINDLPRKNYTAEITGVASKNHDVYLYLDGIRIFQPIDAGNEHYNDAERNAVFLEIRDQIVSGVAAVAQFQSGDMSYSTGATTWVENRNGDYESSQVGGADDYLLAGPNNEVYMNGALNNGALIF